MTAPVRLLIGVLASVLLALLQWRLAAAAAALATLALVWRQPRQPRWQVILAGVSALVVLLDACGATRRWGLPLWQQAVAQEPLLSDLSQIGIAVLALVITLRQFAIERVIIKELNLITQAQLVDSFIQGISEMVSDGDGFLEDWPLERMLAEGRLSALLGSVDGAARARVLRFLSHSGLLSPLQRDQRVGRPILDGQGSYVVDRTDGVPVLSLARLLVGLDLSGTDLTGVDFNGADLSGVDLRRATLRETNLCRCNLSGADLEGADLQGALLFAGDGSAVSPAEAGVSPDWSSGRGTGAMLNRVRMAGVKHLSAEARAYVSRWAGAPSEAPQPLPRGPRSSTPA